MSPKTLRDPVLRRTELRSNLQAPVSVQCFILGRIHEGLTSTVWIQSSGFPNFQGTCNSASLMTHETLNPKPYFGFVGYRLYGFRV